MRPLTCRVIALLAALAAAPAFAQTAAAPSCAANPNAIGIARTVEIDTTGGPGFGLEQYKAHDFLQPKEIVFTFDDGPWPGSTRAVLETLRQHCTKATFFIIGKHALYHPEILREVAAAGHTIGGHTWSHANLAKAKGDKAIEEIEKGMSAIKLALGTAAPSAFFRFPFLQDPKEQLAYLGTRNIAIFSQDVDSFDFKFRKPEEVVKSVLTRLEKKGKGILLMHDFQAVTAKALPELMRELKAAGYKVVHMRAKAPVATLPEWDEAARKEIKGAVGSDKPTTSVVRTIDEVQPAPAAKPSPVSSVPAIVPPAAAAPAPATAPTPATPPPAQPAPAAAPGQKQSSGLLPSMIQRLLPSQ